MKYNEKLVQILSASGWSQERLANELGVSFATLNSWVNQKSQPRTNHLEQIEQLYLDLVGRTEVDSELLATTERAALATHIELDELLTNEELLKTTTLYLTYHTNTIEGSTMTITDVEKVLENENVVLPDKTAREQLEARNHRAAFLYLLAELKQQGADWKWSSELIKGIHLRLMNGIMESAGFYRLHRVRIVGSRTLLADFMEVPDEVEKLVKYMNTTCENIIDRLATTHAIFEQIHPFGDGNGRTGRLIMFAQAMQYGVVPPLVIKERKRAYYKYLEKAQLEDDYDALRLFVAESILTTDKLLRS